MPGRIVFSDRNALALDGVADDGTRPVGRCGRRITEDLPQFTDAVTIALEHPKTEAGPLVGKWLHTLDIEDTAGRLDLVVVDDRRQVGQVVLVGAGGRLPDRSLVDLAVAHQDIDLAVAAAHSC